MKLETRKAAYILVLVFGFYFSLSILFTAPFFAIWAVERSERVMAVLYVVHSFFLPAVLFFIPPRRGGGYRLLDVVVSALFFCFAIMAFFKLDEPVVAPAFRWQWNAVLAYSFLLGVLFLHFRKQGMGTFTAVIYAYVCASLSGELYEAPKALVRGEVHYYLRPSFPLRWLILAKGALEFGLEFKPCWFAVFVFAGAAFVWFLMAVYGDYQLFPFQAVLVRLPFPLLFIFLKRKGEKEFLTPLWGFRMLATAVRGVSFLLNACIVSTCMEEAERELWERYRKLSRYRFAAGVAGLVVWVFAVSLGVVGFVLGFTAVGDVYHALPSEIRVAFTGLLFMIFGLASYVVMMDVFRFIGESARRFEKEMEAIEEELNEG